MQTECNPNLFDFARVENRTIVASFDGGRITSDAGALLLGAADRVLGLTRRFACAATIRMVWSGDQDGRRGGRPQGGRSPTVG
jgi:DDE family transposase